ncbi:MAG: cytochrome c5 family protein [Pseudomonadales bacterium]|nr:cytochrome c5 family protein [Pseudomonadales bacterium]MBO7006072.1 cytochrome c5 family protein [Pseudomonadales bacterium]
MSKIKILVSFLGLILAGFAIASSDIVDRIKPVGEVCIEGHECATAAAATIQVASSGGGDVQSNFNKSCATCHNAGVAGAPKVGDAAAWAPRIEKGMDTLYASTINGLPPAMPAKGMCFSCSDDDLRALVDYMVEAAQ